jgi:ATPase subunit of ABC transporter with duplicated ATPase domains
MFLAPDKTRAAAMATDDPVLRALYEVKADLERRLEELQAIREQMDENRYERELEDLLVELALNNREIRALSGG